MMLFGFRDSIDANDPCTPGSATYNPNDPICALTASDVAADPCNGPNPPSYCIGQATQQPQAEIDMTPTSSAGPRIKVGQTPGGSAAASLGTFAKIMPVVWIGLAAATVFVGWKVLGPGFGKKPLAGIFSKRRR